MLILAVLVAICTYHGTTVGATGDDPQHAAQEAQAKQKLEAVRAEIHALSDEMQRIGGEKANAVSTLRDAEMKVAAAAKRLRESDQKLDAQRAKLAALEKQRDTLDAALKDQREALAALVRSAYAMGRGEELKLLLAQDRIDDVGRMLAYYRYFEHARVGEIEGLLKDLDALAAVQAAIEQETAAMRALRAEQTAEAERLETERAARAQALAELEATLRNRQERLATLGRDEKSLLELLDKLRDIFADIPRELAGAEPFERLRGRLIWPVHGRITTAFGASDEGEHDSHGLMIAAPPGSEVRAVSHGRIVFADWLRGFGLLVIIDHGDGYLSLYGCNEALLKDVGEWVDANEVIATSGASGGRRTPGLYFELRYQGKAIDPRGWLKSSSR